MAGEKARVSNDMQGFTPLKNKEVLFKLFQPETFLRAFSTSAICVSINKEKANCLQRVQMPA
jgi:hypothetical protein